MKNKRRIKNKKDSFICYNEEMNEFLKKISREAGILALSYFNREYESFKKGDDFDIVTKADFEVEKFIIQEIKKNYPDHSIYSEEAGENKNNSEYRWVIDPIDGTFSFYKKNFNWSVSIALQKNKKTIAGVVYAPLLNLFYYAQEGKGAYLNDKRIKVGEERELSKSLICTGFACLRSRWEVNNLPIFNELAIKAMGVRRFGSIALDVCFVADGKLDGAWEMNLNIYDLAAALLIAKEAGAFISDMNAKDEYLYSFPLVTNKYLKDEFLNVFKKYEIPFSKRIKDEEI